MRLHSAKEVKDYLYKKTRPSRTKSGEIKPGVSSEITARVFDRLLEKGYINDEKFAQAWIENRFINKGVSLKKLKSELFAKGVNSLIIDQTLADSGRNDKSELQKIVIKKRSKYPDDKKFISYLVRLGFDYDDIKQVLSINDEF
jgi:regulatory protein